MRSDCHPGNNWNQTVSFFTSCSMALKHLSQFVFDKKDVLWASFQKLDPDFDYNDIGFTWVDLRSDTDDEIDKYIKGQEFHIVVIEGLPGYMNPQDLVNKKDWGETPSVVELEMWRYRRKIYVVCSRASAFLYFIADLNSPSSEANIGELTNLIDRVSHPLREKHEPGQTWRFKITNPSIRRNPVVFKDIDELDDDIDVENKGASNSIEMIVLEFDGNLTVAELSSALEISSEEFRRRLPEDAKAKNDIGKTVKLSHAEAVASQLGKRLKRILKDSFSDITNTKEEVVEKIEPLNPKKVEKKERRTSISYGRDRISQDKLIDYVVKVLYEYGGQATKIDVEKKIYRMLKDIFKQTWYQDTVSNSVHRWKHDIAWAKERAKQHHGFIKGALESGRGLWELTEAGKKYYHTNDLRKLS